MLIMLKHRLVFLATPKTGTTAFETALRPHAEIIFTKNRKHIRAQRYYNKVAPFLKKTFGRSPETLAVIREPIEQLRSWYRYRHRDVALLDMPEHSTADISFDDYVVEVISHDPPPRADVGNQFDFVTRRSGDLMVNHLFAYESQRRLRDFLSQRIGVELEFPLQNVSPMTDAPLSASVEAKLRKARARDFELYERLQAAGGYIQTDIP